MRYPSCKYAPSMSCILFLPRLSNNLHSSFTSPQSPKPIQSSHHRVAANSTIDDSNLGQNASESQNEPTSIVKAPTAPWMRAPLLVESGQVLDLSKPRIKKKPGSGTAQNPDTALTAKIGPGRGKREMKMVLKGIKKLRAVARGSEKFGENPGNVVFKFPPGEMWWDGVSKTDEEFEAKENFSKKLPWVRNESLVSVRVKKEKVVTAAELSLDKELLARLRDEASRMCIWVKVKKAGVTDDVVSQVHFTWKKNELCMIKFDLPLSRNMERALEIVEMKTGGMVVWRKRDTLVVYRGHNHLLAARTHHPVSDVSINENGLTETTTKDDDEEEESIGINKSLYEWEGDRLLDGLGPRFVDWWGPKPLPVDGDLLPEVVPGFMPPSRLSPSHARAQLRDEELTYLRKLAYPLPTHFVLGRNRKLQGLAAAILKLWEKCQIAKIAVKWGVPNTDNKQMAYELKCLTGGVLLLRNKFIILLYRGKDFLPPQVATSVSGRELELRAHQLREERARLSACENLLQFEIASVKSSSSGTLSEHFDIQSSSLELGDRKNKVDIQLEAEKERLENELRNQQRKLNILKKKIEHSAKKVADLYSKCTVSERDRDQEMMTQEEREVLRHIGLKRESCLVLGRRGVFGGVIEGIYQHWKHREIVKVITFQRTYSQVVNTSKILEAESGGILVSIEKLKEGHAVLLYRGKNYKRPKLAPSHLLNKRDALLRSIEMQRMGSLKFFASQREKTISDLESKLEELRERIADQTDICETDEDEVAETQKLKSYEALAQVNFSHGAEKLG